MTSRTVRWGLLAVIVLASVVETEAARRRRGRRGGGEQVEPVIVDDTTWESGKTYRVKERTTVEKGVTLTIEPRVRVQFDEGAGLEVFGRIVAEGQPRRKEVTFESAGRRTWDGILISNRDGEASRLLWCIFRNAKSAVRINDGPVTVESCKFERNGTGLLLGTGQSKPTDTRVTVVNSVFSTNKEYGLHVCGQSPRVHFCSFQRNRIAGVFLEFGGHLRLESCDISRNAKAGLLAGKIADRRRTRRNADEDDDAMGAESADIRVTASNCNIQMNGKLDAHNGSGGEWICVDNYWGAKTLSHLKKEDGNPPNVMGQQDQESFGRVKIRPFKASLIKNVGADLFARNKAIPKTVDDMGGDDDDDDDDDDGDKKAGKADKEKDKPAAKKKDAADD